MNERIKLLAEQAGLEYNFDPMLWLKHEKFAELIVKECALQCNHNDDMDRILEYFGVEE
jgi:hypothetical protein